MKTYIVYHSNCSDGFGAAYSAWKRFGNSVEYVPMGAGDPLPEFEAHSTIFFLDVAPNTREELINLKKENEVHIIDHHAKYKATHSGVEGCLFDINHSGAYLAWKYFNPNVPVPKFIEYIQKKDLHKFNAMEALIINVIYCTPFDFLTWDACLDKGFDEKVFTEQGIAIGRSKESQMNMALNGLHTLKIGGYYVPAVNTKDNVSELAVRLCELFPEAPFAVCYSITSGSRWTFSLRSTGFNVNHMAMKFGGGGHERAAGFKIPFTTLDFHRKDVENPGKIDRFYNWFYNKYFVPEHGGVCVCEEDKYILK